MLNETPDSLVTTDRRLATAGTITAAEVHAAAIARFGEDEVGAAELGETYESMLAMAVRMEGGIYYTPQPVARFMTTFAIEQAIGRIRRDDPHGILRIVACDPLHAQDIHRHLCKRVRYLLLFASLGCIHSIQALPGEGGLGAKGLREVRVCDPCAVNCTGVCSRWLIAENILDLYTHNKTQLPSNGNLFTDRVVCEPACSEPASNPRSQAAMPSLKSLSGSALAHCSCSGVSTRGTQALPGTEPVSKAAVSLTCPSNGLS